jgi:hypothetical protein
MVDTLYSQALSRNRFGREALLSGSAYVMLYGAQSCGKSTIT